MSEVADSEIAWTFEGLASLFAYTLRQGAGGAVFVQVYERGPAWTDGIKCYSAGINGTHHAYLSSSRIGECAGRAEAFAQLVLDETREFPSWRVLNVTAGLDGVSAIAAFGGRYTPPGKV